MMPMLEVYRIHHLVYHLPAAFYDVHLDAEADFNHCLSKKSRFEPRLWK